MPYRNADWQIVPHQGIGRLTFGLSPDEIAALAPLYGEPSPLLSQASVVSDVEDVIAQLGSSLDEDAVAAMRRAAGNLANYATQNLTKGTTPVLLEYRDERLDGVAVEARHKEVNFEGQLVFSLTSLEVLRLFERANGAPGRYRSEEAAFDNLAVSLHLFSTTSSEGEVRVIPEHDPDFRDRTITLRRVPYQAEEESDQFVIHSFDY